MWNHPERVAQVQKPPVLAEIGRKLQIDQILISTTKLSSERLTDIVGQCAAAGLRVATDTGNEKINYKVREHSLAKVPVMLVVGRREAEQRSVALRRLGGSAQESLALAEAVARLKEEAAPPGPH